MFKRAFIGAEIDDIGGHLRRRASVTGDYCRTKPAALGSD